MKRDDIIRMALKAGFDSNPLCPVVTRHSNGSWVGVLDKLCEFAELVAANALAAQDQQAEPVATVKENPYCPEGKSDELTDYLPVGMKLYSRPQRAQAEPAAQVQADAATLNAEKTAHVLHEAVAAFYFDDSSKFKNALGSVIRIIDNELAGNLLCNPQGVYNESLARLDAARAAQKGSEA